MRLPTLPRLAPRLLRPVPVIGTGLRAPWLETVAVLLLIVGLTVGLNLPAFLVVTDSWSQLNILSIDEWSYHRAIDPMVSALASRNLHDLLFYQGLWGYGYLFFLLFGIVLVPFSLLGDVTGQIVAARIVSVLFLALSIFAVYGILRLRQARIVALVGALALLLLPGFYFYTKAFSPEFMAAAPLLWAYYFLFADRYRQGPRFVVSALLFGVAVGIKTSAAMFGPILVLAFLLWPDVSLVTRLRQGVLYVILAGLAFLLTNPFLLVSEGREYFAEQLRQNLADNRAAHGYNAAGVTLLAWYREGIRHDFMNLTLLGLTALAFLKGSFDEWRQRSPVKLVTLVGLSWLVSLLYITLTVNKIWTWYLFPTFLLSTVGLFAMSWPSKRVAAMTLSVVVALLVVTNGPAIVGKYQYRLQAEEDPTYVAQKQSYDAVASYLDALPSTPADILKTAYVYFEEEHFPAASVHPMWGSFSPSHLTAYHPDVILYEKGYDIFEDDETIQSWSSAGEVFAGRELYRELLGDGVTIDGQDFRYELVFETDTVFVLQRRISDS